MIRPIALLAALISSSVNAQPVAAPAISPVKPAAVQQAQKFVLVYVSRSGAVTLHDFATKADCERVLGRISYNGFMNEGGVGSKSECVAL